jgi:hypothetical protein
MSGGRVKGWKTFLSATLVTLAIGGIYLFTVWRHRQNPGVAGQDQAPKETRDDVAVVRMDFPQHFDDLKNLEGKSVWMKNGYTMPYFSYANGKVDFKNRAGVIPSAQKLDVKKAIRAAPPADVDDGISHGTRQAMYVFTFPGDEKNQYATPVGVMDAGQEQYYSDLLFFYDDPHTIYSHWPKDVWAAVDAHQVKPGMNELQTRMAIGQKMHADSRNEGNRTVTYDQAGKKWTVTFANDRATGIKPG